MIYSVAIKAYSVLLRICIKIGNALIRKIRSPFVHEGGGSLIYEP